MSFSFGPGVVKNGLVLYLDAANPQSYVSGSTNWNDLSGNRNTGSLIGGPTFNSANGGSIVFDGNNDYVEFTPTFVRTICFWGRLDSGAPTLPGLICNSVTGDTSLRIETDGSNKSFRNAAATDSQDFHKNFESSLMINGVSNLPSSGSLLEIPNGRTIEQDFYVGALGNGINVISISHTFLNRYYKGRVYAVILYNRWLTNDELLQNYNALKSRFGLT